MRRRGPFSGSWRAQFKRDFVYFPPWPSPSQKSELRRVQGVLPSGGGLGESPGHEFFFSHGKGKGNAARSDSEAALGEVRKSMG